MIQHPQYADWGIECRNCHAFIPLPDDADAPVHCPECSLETSVEEVLASA